MYHRRGGIMDGLEEVLDTMEELHRLRNHAQELRASGIRALLARRNKPGNPKLPDPWDAADDPVEWSLILRTFQLARRQRLLTADERAQLGAAIAETVLRANDRCLAGTLFQEDRAPPVPVLAAARMLQALAVIPSQVFSPLGVACYSRIVRELYTVCPPDWMVGSARAGIKGVASAFATNECVRAVLGVARSLKDTAKLAELLGYFAERTRTIHDELFERFHLQDWARIERFRSALALHVAATSIGLRTFVEVKALDVPATDDSEVIAWANKLGTEVAAQLAGEVPEIEKRLTAHVAELEAMVPEPLDATPHALVLKYLRTALNDVAAVRAIVTANPAPTMPWEMLAKLLVETAGRVEKVVDPARSYLSAVIDHELAAGRNPASVCDYADLAFAAAAYASITRRWDETRLADAARILAAAMLADGTLPMGRPFHVQSGGLRLHTIGFEVTRAFAYVMRHLDHAPLSAETATRLMRPFHTLQPNQEIHGWCDEQPPIPRRPTVWTSTIAILALDNIVRVLSLHINRELTRHFTVTSPKGLQLHELLYGDYGIATHIGEKKRQAAWPHDSSEPIAILLQRMRAHVCAGQVPTATRPAHTAILFGPPGTGKTTLAEALAATCKAPLFTVTPSDIVIGGQEKAERRARAVFRALSFITRAVILFDEFDSILSRRDGKQPTSTFGFILPGMLPKLRDLYDRSRQNGVVYLLATNMMYSLDDAAIRDGRFDVRAGVYPSDALSRAGSLLYAATQSQISTIPTERFAACVKATTWVPTAKLAKPGFLLRLLGHLQNESLPSLPRADESFVYIKPSPDQPDNPALRREREEVHEVYLAVEGRVLEALRSIRDDDSSTHSAA
ncbi:MAG: AAA family ATPase [Deltaproteobacteria bacterium]|nr:MAG: AAA family ATPase [Deltaproteobacteria bacterium]